MKLAFISDTHGNLPENYLSEEVDILFHCGDICPPRDHHPSFQSVWLRDNFYPWFAAQPAKHKVLISGNHDFVFQDAREALCKPPEGVTYLEHESVVIDGLKIFGTPWQPWFYDWAWNAPPVSVGGRDFMRNKWADIPVDTNILITHCPPFGILDGVNKGSGREGHAGCRDLLDVLTPFRLPSLQLVASGHIHENPQLFYDDVVGVQFINAAMTDNNYRLLNTPVIIEYNPK